MPPKVALIFDMIYSKFEKLIHFFAVMLRGFPSTEIFIPRYSKSNGFKAWWLPWTQADQCSHKLDNKTFGTLVI